MTKLKLWLREDEPAPFLYVESHLQSHWIDMIRDQSEQHQVGLALAGILRELVVLERRSTWPRSAAHRRLALSREHKVQSAIPRFPVEMALWTRSTHLLDCERLGDQVLAKFTKMPSNSSFHVVNGHFGWTEKTWIDFVEIVVVVFENLRKWFAKIP